MSATVRADLFVADPMNAVMAPARPLVPALDESGLLPIISGEDKNRRVPASESASGHFIAEVNEDYLGTSVAFDFTL